MPRGVDPRWKRGCEKNALLKVETQEFRNLIHYDEQPDTSLESDEDWLRNEAGDNAEPQE
jgi:hypothetical protein